MRFAYTRRGGPLLDWSGPTPPYQSRAGETRSLGEWSAPLAYDPVNGGQALSYGHGLGSLDMHIPRPGAPEIISGYESPHPNAALIHFGADEKAAAPVDSSKLVRRASALAAGYHGVRRNNGSIFWGLIWAAAAFISPFHGLLVPMFGVAQGFGQARPKSNPAKSKRRGRTWLRRMKARKARKGATERASTKRRRLGGRKTKRMGTRRGVGAYSLRKR